MAREKVKVISIDDYSLILRSEGGEDSFPLTATFSFAKWIREKVIEMKAQDLGLSRPQIALILGSELFSEIEEEIVWLEETSDDLELLLEFYKDILKTLQVLQNREEYKEYDFSDPLKKVEEKIEELRERKIAEERVAEELEKEEVAEPNDGYGYGPLY